MLVVKTIYIIRITSIISIIYKKPSKMFFHFSTKRSIIVLTPKAFF